MAASLIMVIGQPNAFPNLKPTQPPPRFRGSLTGFPCSTTP
jgi:hypothetical protein